MNAHAFVHGYECHLFSERDRYRLMLHWLLDHCRVQSGSAVVDLGCGSGALIEETLARVGDAPELRIIGIDPSRPELELARARISDPRVTLIQGRAQEALGSVAGADVVFLSNVLHLIPRDERFDLFSAVHDALAPGGRFGLNTPFYDGAVAPGTRWFYMRWMLRTREYLEAMGISPRAPDLESPARQTLSVADHESLLYDAGFSSVGEEEVVFEWGPEDWSALSAYSLFIRGALGDVDLAAGQEALTRAVRATFDDLGLQSVPRRWLHLVAAK